MTCKDCVHYEPCFEYGNILDPLIGGVKCDSFKSKADYVEVEKVANMFAEQFGDCPCNFNSIDEWLPYVCEHNDVCECSVEAGWEQFIRHYEERIDNNAE